uniref:efflux RND transporter periplasmic adaptor subunit n=1 Tax=Acetatifactor sp. TaxID=1872090 RepID=UPI0040576C07
MKRRILASLLVGGMLLSVTGCGQQTTDAPQNILVQEDEDAAYPTTTVDYGDVVKNIKVRCSYTSTDKQELSFGVDNKLIERVEVKMGDFVSAGELLVALDVENLEAQIEELEFQVKTQELKLQQTLEMKQFELESAERLYGYTAMTEQDQKNLTEQKENIEAQYKMTIEDMSDALSIQKQRLQQYLDELEAGQLIADRDGEITYLENGVEGTYSVKDRIVVTVSNLDACYFTTENTEYSECFEEGVSVTVVYRVSGKEYECEVVPALMDSWEEKMYFKPVDESLISSETDGTITMEYGRKENVLCVPADAIHESDNGLFVYLENNGLLEMRYVTVGLEGDTLVEITGGLEQGEIIALKN